MRFIFGNGSVEMSMTWFVDGTGAVLRPRETGRPYESIGNRREAGHGKRVGVHGGKLFFLFWFVSSTFGTAGV